MDGTPTSVHNDIIDEEVIMARCGAMHDVLSPIAAKLDSEHRLIETRNHLFDRRDYLVRQIKLLATELAHVENECIMWTQAAKAQTRLTDKMYSSGGIESFMKTVLSGGMLPK